jgi:MFS transporter, OFA family, oxalate/formate antiporter
MPNGVTRSGRWMQLWLGVLSMALIANLQYSWTLFVEPMRLAQHWSLRDIQWAFSIFVAAETWLTPVAGSIADRLNPRWSSVVLVASGGMLMAIGWGMNAYAETLHVLYAGAVVSGTGAGAIYATCVGNAVKWFPDRRGLAVGLTAAGFGAGAALTAIPIALTIASAGYAAAFLWFGLGQGMVLVCVALCMRGPSRTVGSGTVSALDANGTGVSSSVMLRSPIFWLLYAMFVAISASGLMATAQLAPVAKDYGIDHAELLFGFGTLSVALIVDNVLNGLARPFFGAISDWLGRETTMAIAFTLGSVSYLLLAVLDPTPWRFVICAGLVFFTWGEIFSLFPSIATDTFGSKHAAANASLLYTAKGASAFLVPLANFLRDASGGWQVVFLTASLTNLAVALLAVTALRWMRQARLARSDELSMSQS